MRPSASRRSRAAAGLRTLSPAHFHRLERLSQLGGSKSDVTALGELVDELHASEEKCDPWWWKDTVARAHVARGTLKLRSAADGSLSDADAAIKLQPVWEGGCVSKANNASATGGHVRW